MVSEIILSSKKEFDKKIKEIKKDGLGKLHVLADFDRTLTKCFVNGKRTPSIISVLRSEHYLSEEYSRKAQELADKYHPIEINHKVPLEEKKKAMEGWWRKHFDLLIKSGLNRKNLKRVIDEENVEFRKGALEFIDSLHENSVPLVIISSSGIGDLIPMFLKRQGVLYDNVFILTNLYEWDSKGNATGVKPPLIHVFNKDETVLRDFPKIYGKIKNRKNVLLLGDSIGDLGMIEGFDYNILIKIGFLNENIKEDLDLYKKKFDVVITNDGSMDYLNKIMDNLK